MHYGMFCMLTAMHFKYTILHTSSRMNLRGSKHAGENKLNINLENVAFLSVCAVQLYHNARAKKYLKALV